MLSRRTFAAFTGTAALGLSLSASAGTGTGSGGPAGSATRLAPTGPAPDPPAADGRRHTVGFDRYSLLVDGRRLVLWSGEMHPFRLPSPSLWRDVLQGEAVGDPVRGPLNTGGLYGERSGWHLPGYGDEGWDVVGLPRAEGRRQGVTWYRTGFRLAVDPGVDASIRLELADDPVRANRVQIFLNGAGTWASTSTT